MSQEYDQETKDYEVDRHAVFWSDDGCKSLYKNHLKCVASPSSVHRFCNPCLASTVGEQGSRGCCEHMPLLSLLTLT